MQRRSFQPIQLSLPAVIYKGNHGISEQILSDFVSKVIPWAYFMHCQQYSTQRNPESTLFRAASIGTPSALIPTTSPLSLSELRVLAILAHSSYL
jgi:hypothetical protein